MCLNTNKIKSVLVLFGLTLEDIAQLLDKKDKSTISKKFNNDTQITLIEAKKITDLINEKDENKQWIIEDIFF